AEAAQRGISAIGSHRARQWGNAAADGRIFITANPSPSYNDAIVPVFVLPCENSNTEEAMSETAQATVNPDKLNAFMGRMLGDLGALANSVLVHLGDQLGLYKALSQSGPTTPAALARQTETTERLVREWLSAQAAQGYVSYDKASGEFSLSP